jgi:hypothetical protein
VPLLKHCDRCGCREGYLGSYHNGAHWPVSRQGEEQQSASVLQGPSPGSAQQVPLLQGFELQHRSPLAQEPPFSRQGKQ